MNKIKLILYLIVIILLLTGCANVENINDCVVEEPYGFWNGLLHGIIAPFSFIGSLFSESISMYGVNNTGGWYDFGFALGAGILFSASSNKK